MRKVNKMRSGLSAGFTLIELLVIIIIFAVMAGMAAPALMTIVPTYQLHGATEAISGAFYTAKMTAATIQKPVRVVVDCQRTNEGCRSAVYLPVFDEEGKLVAFSPPTTTPWVVMSGTARILADRVTVAIKPMVAPDPPVTVFPGNPVNLYWAVFFPSGRVLASSHDPFTLVLTGRRARGVFEISVDNANGSISVAETGS